MGSLLTFLNFKQERSISSWNLYIFDNLTGNDGYETKNIIGELKILDVKATLFTNFICVTSADIDQQNLSIFQFNITSATGTGSHIIINKTALINSILRS